jgi:tRNA(fMet)-specific endonuclease VapC
MNGVVVDTNAYAAFKQGQPDAVDIIQRAPRLALSSTILGELLAGFAV